MRGHSNETSNVPSGTVELTDKWGIRADKIGWFGLNLRFKHGCEIYVEGLNLLNRIVAMLCIALIFTGYFSDDSEGVVKGNTRLS